MEKGKLHPYTSWQSDEAYSDAQNGFPVFQQIYCMSSGEVCIGFEFYILHES
jgi:hypothetical protein